MAKVTLGTSALTRDGQAVHCSCEFEAAEFDLSMPKASQMRALLRAVLGRAELGGSDAEAAIDAIAADIRGFFAGPAANGTLGEDAENMVSNVLAVARKYDADLGKTKLLKPSAAAIDAITRSKK